MAKLKPFMADMGRSDIKTTTLAPVRSEDYFPHAFAKISVQDFERNTKRGGSQLEDYFIVNGVPYVIGQKAVRQGFKIQLNQNRYNENYYGVLAAIAMARSFRQSTNNVFWVGTHAPEDIDYTDDLLRSVVSTWSVVWCDESMTFTVVDGATIDEPLAGYYNAILRADGQAYIDKRIVAGTTLMLDIGGFTTDAGTIDPNGEIDYSSFRSEHIGVLAAVTKFGDDYRSDNRDLLKGVELDHRQLHTALRTGNLDLRGLNERGTNGYDVSGYANYVRRELANEVVNFYDRYGGAAYFNTLILTGGGGALLEHELIQLIRHNNIVLADKKTDELHMANARGARKWYLMHEALRTFS